MYLHVFLFKWKPEATEALRARAAKDIAALQGQIPGLLEAHVGQNESPRANGHSFGGVMMFESREAFQAYVPHPVHAALGSWLMPLIEPTEMDFPA